MLELLHDLQQLLSLFLTFGRFDARRVLVDQLLEDVELARLRAHWRFVVSFQLVL